MIQISQQRYAAELASYIGCKVRWEVESKVKATGTLTGVSVSNSDETYYATILMNGAHYACPVKEVEVLAKPAKIASIAEMREALEYEWIMQHAKEYIKLRKKVSQDIQRKAEAKEVEGQHAWRLMAQKGYQIPGHEKILKFAK